MREDLDYRRFLQKAMPPLVLPVTDPRAGFICAPGREMRLENRVRSPGYYEVAVRGRRATLGRRVSDPPQDMLAKQPRISGHAWGEMLVTDQGTCVPMSLLPPEDPPQRFAPVTAVEWEDGTAIFFGLRFETAVEEQVRQAYEEGGEMPAGLPASLRSAYGYALLDRAARDLREAWSPLELLHRISDVAAGGAEVARSIMADQRDRRLAAVAREQVRQQAAAAARQAEEVRRLAAERTAQLAAERAAREAAARQSREAAFAASGDAVQDALRASGATLLDTRRMGDRLEVRWRFLGQRFVSIVDPVNLHVLDSGICLQNHDEELTLWSLPSTIREAVDTNVLHITRR